MAIDDVSTCEGQAFLKVFTPLDIKFGFKKIEIYIFDKKNFNEEDFYGC